MIKRIMLALVAAALLAFMAVPALANIEQDGDQDGKIDQMNEFNFDADADGGDADAEGGDAEGDGDGGDADAEGGDAAAVNNASVAQNAALQQNFQQNAAEGGDGGDGDDGGDGGDGGDADVEGGDQDNLIGEQDADSDADVDIDFED